jgi:hypothetical protein
MGWYNYVSSPVKPRWHPELLYFAWLSTQMVSTTYHNRKTTSAQRRASLRKIAK